MTDLIESTDKERELMHDIIVKDNEIEQLKRLHQSAVEEHCADDIQRILEKHKCSLMPLPDSRFEIKYVG